MKITSVKKKICDLGRAANHHKKLYITSLPYKKDESLLLKQLLEGMLDIYFENKQRPKEKILFENDQIKIPTCLANICVKCLDLLDDTDSLEVHNNIEELTNETKLKILIEKFKIKNVIISDIKALAKNYTLYPIIVPQGKTDITISHQELRLKIENHIKKGDLCDIDFTNVPHDWIPKLNEEKAKTEKERFFVDLKNKHPYISEEIISSLIDTYTTKLNSAENQYIDEHPKKIKKIRRDQLEEKINKELGKGYKDSLRDKFMHDICKKFDFADNIYLFNDKEIKLIDSKTKKIPMYSPIGDRKKMWHLVCEDVLSANNLHKDLEHFKLPPIRQILTSGSTPCYAISLPSEKLHAFIKMLHSEENKEVLRLLCLLEEVEAKDIDESTIAWEIRALEKTLSGLSKQETAQYLRDFFLSTLHLLGATEIYLSISQYRTGIINIEPIEILKILDTITPNKVVRSMLSKDENFAFIFSLFHKDEWEGFINYFDSIDLPSSIITLNLTRIANVKAEELIEFLYEKKLLTKFLWTANDIYTIQKKLSKEMYATFQKHIMFDNFYSIDHTSWTQNTLDNISFPYGTKKQKFFDKILSDSTLLHKVAQTCQPDALSKILSYETHDKTFIIKSILPSLKKGAPNWKYGFVKLLSIIPQNMGNNFIEEFVPLLKEITKNWSAGEFGTVLQYFLGNEIISFKRLLNGHIFFKTLLPSFQQAAKAWIFNDADNILKIAKRNFADPENFILYFLPSFIEAAKNWDFSNYKNIFIYFNDGIKFTFILELLPHLKKSAVIWPAMHFLNLFNISPTNIKECVEKEIIPCLKEASEKWQYPDFLEIVENLHSVCKLPNSHNSVDNFLADNKFFKEIFPALIKSIEKWDAAQLKNFSDKFSKKTGLTLIKELLPLMKYEPVFSYVLNDNKNFKFIKSALPSLKKDIKKWRIPLLNKFIKTFPELRKELLPQPEDVKNWCAQDFCDILDVIPGKDQGQYVEYILTPLKESTENWDANSFILVLAFLIDKFKSTNKKIKFENFVNENIFFNHFSYSFKKSVQTLTAANAENILRIATTNFTDYNLFILFFFRSFIEAAKTWNISDYPGFLIYFDENCKVPFIMELLPHIKKIAGDWPAMHFLQLFQISPTEIKEELTKTIAPCLKEASEKWQYSDFLAIAVNLNFVCNLKPNSYSYYNGIDDFLANNAFFKEIFPAFIKSIEEWDTLQINEILSDFYIRTDLILIKELLPLMKYEHVLSYILNNEKSREIIKTTLPSFKEDLKSWDNLTFILKKLIKTFPELKTELLLYTKDVKNFSAQDFCDILGATPTNECEKYIEDIIIPLKESIKSWDNGCDTALLLIPESIRHNVINAVFPSLQEASKNWSLRLLKNIEDIIPGFIEKSFSYIAESTKTWEIGDLKYFLGHMKNKEKEFLLASTSGLKIAASKWTAHGIEYFLSYDNAIYQKEFFEIVLEPMRPSASLWPLHTFVLIFMSIYCQEAKKVFCEIYLSEIENAIKKEPDYVIKALKTLSDFPHPKLRDAITSQLKNLAKNPVCNDTRFLDMLLKIDENLSMEFSMEVLSIRNQFNLLDINEIECLAIERILKKEWPLTTSPSFFGKSLPDIQHIEREKEKFLEQIKSIRSTFRERESLRLFNVLGALESYQAKTMQSIKSKPDI